MIDGIMVGPWTGMIDGIMVGLWTGMIDRIMVGPWKVSLLFCLQLFFLSLLFPNRLVVWGWGLRTHMVSISLSQPCIANLF